MRPEKATIVADLSDKLKRSPFVLVADYQRMKVSDFAELRNRLMPTGAELHVVKNNFLKRAMADSGFPDVSEKLLGQTAVVTGENDVAPVAKVLKKFATEFKIAALKIGLVDKSILSTTELETLADLPPREVLLAQFLGLLMSPATKLVRLLNEPASQFARLLGAKARSMPAEPEKPAALKEAAPEPVKEAAPEAQVAEAPAVEPAKEAAPETPAAEAPKVEASPEAPAPEAKTETVAENTAPVEPPKEEQSAPEGAG